MSSVAPVWMCMIAVIGLTIGTVLVFYILIGYPLYLARAQHRRAPKIRKDRSHRRSVTVLLAVHNGEPFLRAKLESLLALQYPRDLLEIFVLSDGSTDCTDAIALHFADRNVRLFRLPKAGKAVALNTGLAQAKGDIIFFTDVRQRLDTLALRELVANFADPSVGAVTGELRYTGPGHEEHFDMDLYWRYELWVRSRHSEIDSLFNTTGCIYAMRRDLLAPLPPDTLTDDAALPLRAFEQGFRVIFDPAAVAYDYPAVKGQEFRRRMRTLAGMWQVYVRTPDLFYFWKRMRFHFLSHKFSRLALPWAILLVLTSTFLLEPSSVRTFLLWNEMMLPLLALADEVIPRGFFLKRLTSAAHTFVLMNFAALCSVSIFFLPPAAMWKTPTKVEID